MPDPHPTPDDTPPRRRFTARVEAFTIHPGVSAPDGPGRRGFGSNALKVNGSIFAMLTRDQLIVKLSQHWVHAAGASFIAGKTNPMKEWLTVLDHEGQAHQDTWLSLAHEALTRTGRRS